MLRWLVSNYLRQSTKQKVFTAASQFMGGAKQQQTKGESESESESESPPPQAAGPVQPCDVGLVFAIGLESGGLVDLMENTVTTKCHTFIEHSGNIAGRKVVAIETGEGQQKTNRAVQDFFTMHRPTWVVSCGFAEGLKPDLQRGDIVMADQLIDEKNSEFTTQLHIDRESISQTAHLHIGRLLTVQANYRTSEQRQSLGAQYDAIACDLESMGIATLCAQHDTQFLAVRIITDAQSDNPPPEVSGYLQQQSLAGKMGAAAGTLFRKPSALKTMFQLRRSALKASDRLAKFLSGLVGQLPQS